ncbi:hypothetical protein CASFOL_014139 [Castilleja foliolosa]|uniref:Wax synthase domain-containing protein n=1 Tax=Castilleja foliolosa TaxID=1961234 RepID=A0ABD3DQN2_9LAMI
MEEEIINFIKVWSSVHMSACYCYGISKLVPKGTIRFFMFLPVLCLFVLLPLSLNKVNLILPTAFCVTWLATFKVLLLVFGTGPLSSPSLSLSQFVFIFCLPIKLQWARSPNSGPIREIKHPKKTWNQGNTNKIGLRSILRITKKFPIMIFLLFLGYNKHRLPRDIVLLLSCFFGFTGLETGLEAAAFIGRLSLGMQVEPPFDGPYSSTSFQDFWGRRWNRVASNSLRSTVFDPTLHYTSRTLGRKWAIILALLATFIVSDLMHEIIYYYMGRVRPGWGTLSFFLVQGLCVVIESTLKRKISSNWQVPQKIIGPLIFVFVLCTYTWLGFTELMEHNVTDRALEEYAAFGTFVMNLGLDWVKMGYNLLVKLCSTIAQLL